MVYSNVLLCSAFQALLHQVPCWALESPILYLKEIKKGGEGSMESKIQINRLDQCLFVKKLPTATANW